MDLLPAIDLRGGQVVRLRQGDDERRTVYGEDPLAVLEDFAAAGVRRVHVVDLDAAFGDPAHGDGSQRPLIAELAAAAAARGLALQLGGGLRRREDFLWALGEGEEGGAGCRRAVVSSILARDPELFRALVREFPGRIVPALDFKGGKLGIAGWKETTDLGLEELCDFLQGLDCPAILVTDIARDGEMGGPNFELAREVGRRTGIPALLSGGVHSLDDLRRAREMLEIGGAVVGRALYDGTFRLPEALAACGGAP